MHAGGPTIPVAHQRARSGSQAINPLSLQALRDPNPPQGSMTLGYDFRNTANSAMGHSPGLPGGTDPYGNHH